MASCSHKQQHLRSSLGFLWIKWVQCYSFLFCDLIIFLILIYKFNIYSYLLLHTGLPSLQGLLNHREGQSEMICRYCFIRQLVHVSRAAECSMSPTAPLIIWWMVYVVRPEALSSAFAATIAWSIIITTDMGTGPMAGLCIPRGGFLLKPLMFVLLNAHYLNSTAPWRKIFFQIVQNCNFSLCYVLVSTHIAF